MNNDSGIHCTSCVGNNDKYKHRFVLVKGAIKDAFRARRVAGIRFNARVIYRELPEIGGNREREPSGVGVTAELVGGFGGLPDIYGRLFGLHKNLRAPPIRKL